MEAQMIPQYICGKCRGRIEEIKCAACTEAIDKDSKLECFEGLHFHTDHKKEKWWKFAGKLALLDPAHVRAIVGPSQLLETKEDFTQVSPEKSTTIFETAFHEGDYYEELVGFDELRELLKEIKQAAGVNPDCLVLRISKFHRPLQVGVHLSDIEEEGLRAVLAPRHADWFKKETEKPEEGKPE